MKQYLMEIEKKQENKRHHNGIISFWKFMFCIMIAIFHVTEAMPEKGTLMKHGRIGVEFFFLVSGYLMAQKALNQKEKKISIGQETIQYLWKKIKSFFPYVLIAFIFSFLINNYYEQYTKSEMVNTFWNMFLLEMSGIRGIFIIDHTWYISAMLISMLILYPLLRRHGKNFTHIIAPIIVFFIGGWIAHKTGNLRGPFEWMGLTYKGVLRAFFEIALGTILYEIAENIKKVKFTEIGEHIYTFIEIIGFSSIFIIVNIQNASDKYDFWMLLILAISVILAFGEKSIFYNYASNKFVFYLEKLSFPIYLNHIWIIKLIMELFDEISYSLTVITVIISSIVFSIICVYLIEKLKKINFKKINKIFIEY